MKGNRNARNIARWLKKTALAIHKNDTAECASWTFDGTNYSLSVGWLGGFDEKDKNDGLLHSKKQPSYTINCGIKIYNPYDCADFEFMDMPYNKESGDVWDSSISLAENATDDDYLFDAKFMLKELKGIIKEYGTHFNTRG